MSFNVEEYMEKKARSVPLKVPEFFELFNSKERMIRRPIVVDHCCSRQIARYLEQKGNSVTYVKGDMKDEQIKSMANDMGAYILTADRGMAAHDIGFRDYQNAMFIMPNARPTSVWRCLRTLMRSEYECTVSML